MMEQEGRVNNLESRVSRIELAVESTQNSINTLAQNTERQIAQLASATESQIDRLALSLEKMVERQTYNSKTNWQVIFSGVSVALAIILSLGGGFVKVPLDRLTEQVQSEQKAQTIVHERLRERLLAHDTMLADLSAKSENCQMTQKDIMALPGEVIQLKEQVTSLEREVFAGSQYRSSRPTK